MGRRAGVRVWFRSAGGQAVTRQTGPGAGPSRANGGWGAVF